MEEKLEVPLAPPHSFFLNAATGWLELGNTAEARAELSQLPTQLQLHPAVLEVRWAIEAEDGHWPEALKTANLLAEVRPDSPSGWLHRAYALRRAPGGGLQQAFQALQPIAERFPEEPTIPYNLACYACQLGLLEEARSWFRRSVAAGSHDAMKKLALADSDLQPLWDEIRRM